MPSLFLRTKLDEPSLFPSKNGRFIEFGWDLQRTYMGGTWEDEGNSIKLKLLKSS